MNINLYIEIICGLFSFIFGVWLFEYILKGGRKTNNQQGGGENKLYILSMIFMLIGAGLIVAAVISFTFVDEVYQ